MRKKPVYVLTDADNTLWNTNAVFLTAQNNIYLNVLRALNIDDRINSRDPIAFVRSIDQAIATRHHRHLKYPPRLLVYALVSALQGNIVAQAVDDALGGKKISTIATDVVEGIVNFYEIDIASIPDLMPTVRDGLILAGSKEIDLKIITEGRVEKQKAILDAHGISDMFSSVLEISKSHEQFRKIAKRFSDGLVYVIGDQLDRDVIPALRANLNAIYVQGGFQPGWNAGINLNQEIVEMKTFVEAIYFVLSHADEC